METIQIFQYNGNDIEFELTSNTVMVNATEMAKVFGKTPKDFLRNQQTIDFIVECCKDENYFDIMGFEETKNEAEIELRKANSPIETREKNILKVVKGGDNKEQGTWMHRVLALKFAAWLNPSFELWVYRTIEHLLFSAYREVDTLTVTIFKAEAKIKEYEDQFSRELPSFFEYKNLQSKVESLKRRRTTKVNNAPTFF